MYEVTTVTKTLLITNDEQEAIRRAEVAFQTYRYVEIKKVVTTSPWYAIIKPSREGGTKR